MTEAPPSQPLPRRRLMPWLATGAVLTTIAAAGMLGWMSPVAVLDIISLWPVLAIVLLLAAVISIRRRAAAPLLLSLTSFLVLAVGVHYSEWQALPSASADITRVVDSQPDVGTLLIDLDEGELLVSAGSGSYRIKPIRAGGDLGPPAAVESGLPDTLKLEVVERPTNEWFRFSGWAIGLGIGTRWDLSLAAPLLTVDFEGIRVGTARLSGDGTVRLPAGGKGGLVLAGDFAVSLGSDAAAEVVGEAVVPGDWSPTTGGYQSPGGGGGWVITVEPGSVVSVTAG